jgi:hypothetical protein
MHHAEQRPKLIFDSRFIPRRRRRFGFGGARIDPRCATEFWPSAGKLKIARNFLT